MTRRRLLIEWLIGAMALCALAGFLSLPDPTTPASIGARRFDALLFDSLQRLNTVPVPDDLLIVEIDDASLRQIGRWPWSRAVHVALLERLEQSGARVIGSDIQLLEPGAGDAMLAGQLHRMNEAGHPLVLPVSAASEGDGRMTPLYPLRQFGRESLLGHAHFHVDRDGVVRGLYLQEAGFAAFSLVLVAQRGDAMLPDIARQAQAMATPERRDRAVATGEWPRGQFVLLPRLDGSIARVSAGALLRGDVDPARLAGRTVLIGSTASGLGDQYANAVVARAGLSYGVELHAAAVAAIAGHQLVRLAPPALRVGLPLVMVLALMLLLYRLAPQTGLLVTLGFALLALLVAGLAMRAGLWWSPAPALLGCLLAYPLWSWRRLEVATQGLALQASSLAAEPVLLPPGRVGLMPAEPVARSVYRLQEAANRSLALRRFLQLTLQRLPHPAFVTHDDGWLVFANDKVAAIFGAEPEPGVPMRHWLAERAGLNLEPLPPGGGQTELVDRDGRDWLVDSARLDDPGWTRATLWQLVDITPIRAAQREREQTLSFLSHDLRAPQVSIMAILEQAQAQGARQPWLADIRLQAQRSLELADSFVQLARADSQTIEPQPVDLAMLATEAADGCWRLAQSRAIQVSVNGLQEGAMTLGDAQLLRRTLANLLDNAIKFSPDGARVTITTIAGRFDDGQPCWAVRVADEGVGLSDEALTRVFEPYWRGENGIDRPGAGLGLTFVKRVAERHHGTVRALHGTPRGAVFELRLPRWGEPPETDTPGNNRD